MHELKKIVSSLKKNSCDKDGINSTIVKLAFDIIGNRFLDTINSSLNTGVFPDVWKISTVIPIPKIPNTQFAAEHRPINTLPILEKVLELAVKDQLLKFINDKEILIKQQSGFRKCHSCETALQFLIPKWKVDIHNKKIIGVVFLDIQRAFETININLLLKKLNKYGIEGKVFDWFQSYLQNREQLVKYNNTYSNKEQVKNGVPQGSVLGPILFILFINDIIHHVQHCKLKLFADDTLLYFSGEKEDMEKFLNEDLENISNWICDNGLKINVTKTKFMIISSKANTKMIKENKIKFNVQINGESIEEVKMFKYLGVIIDNQLNFNSHCDYIKKKMARKIDFMYRLGDKVSHFTKLTIYKSIIAPHIDYCGTLLSYLSNEQINTLQKIQNRAMRAVLNCKRRTPISTMLNTLQVMNVKQRVVYNTLIFVYKLKNTMLPSYLSSELNYIQDVHCHNTRRQAANDFYINSENVSCDTLFTKGLVLFNNLPHEMKRSVSLDSFKKSCVVFVKENY